MYAPTLDSDEEVKDEFYEQLQSVVEKVNKHHMVIITGGMNAKVGACNEDKERIMGTHGTGTINEKRRKTCGILWHEQICHNRNHISTRRCS